MTSNSSLGFRFSSFSHAHIHLKDLVLLINAQSFGVWNPSTFLRMPTQQRCLCIIFLFVLFCKCFLSMSVARRVAETLAGLTKYLRFPRKRKLGQELCLYRMAAYTTRETDSMFTDQASCKYLYSCCALSLLLSTSKNISDLIVVSRNLRLIFFLHIKNPIAKDGVHCCDSIEKNLI